MCIYLIYSFIMTFVVIEYAINIVVMMMIMMFVGLRPRMIGSWLSYEMWDFKSVNKLNIDNLEPPDIGETLPKFW